MAKMIQLLDKIIDWVKLTLCAAKEGYLDHT